MECFTLLVGVIYVIKLTRPQHQATSPGLTLQDTRQSTALQKLLLLFPVELYLWYGSDSLLAGIPNNTWSFPYLAFGNYITSGTTTSGGLRYAKHNAAFPVSTTGWSFIENPNFSASRCSSVYGRSSTVTPLSHRTLFMIRF